jgi:nucleoside 2-deoxyribosyltransferase
MQLYFAAPLFCEAERRFNRDLCGRLEDAGHDTFLPQRDGFEGIESLLEHPDIDGEAEAMDAIFETDEEELLGADAVVAVLDGRVPDEGVAVELGLAHANDVPVYGLKTDSRVFSDGEALNAMVHGCLTALYEDPEEVVARLADD